MELSKLTLRRFLTAKAFVDDLRAMHAFSFDYTNEACIERLEKHGLLFPRIRLHFPEGVGRRMWLENCGDNKTVIGEIEPDGPRWNAAVNLANEIYRWQNRRVYEVGEHPFDNYVEGQSEFLYIPSASKFVPWTELRVDVSNNSEVPLYTTHNSESYYAPWQVLIAAEAADMGIFYGANLIDSETFDTAWSRANEGEAPGTAFGLRMQGVSAIRKINEDARILDAVVWNTEEARYAEWKYIPAGAGRYRLSSQQTANFSADREHIASLAVEKFSVTQSDLVALSKFLIERWDTWFRIGRPLIADAYKIFAAATVRLLQLAFKVSLADLELSIGEEFREIWPDWAIVQKERLSRTLRAVLKDVAVDDHNIERFGIFLIDEGLESFFWRLQSFEDQVFRGNEFSFQGMRSELQGFAITIEQVARALGGTKDQLDKIFEELWKNPAVSAHLATHRWLVRQSVQKVPWDEFKRKMDIVKQRGPAGSVAADLLMARRIRGAVHYSLPIDDDFEIEQLFVGLIRAALYTFLEVRGPKLSVTDHL